MNINESQIQYITGDTSLGKVLVADDLGGVCAILLGDTEEQVRIELQRSFPGRLLLSHKTDDLKELLDKTIMKLECPRLEWDYQLHMIGTPFQVRVWQEIQKIPPGFTRSYSEIAIAMNSPKSVRAVANACGANRLAVMVPCHRVSRLNGNLGGYRWGTRRKHQIIELEKAMQSIV